MNQITKLNLESRARELKLAGESERTIASILSSEANQKITQSSLHRYLANNTKVTQQAIESNDKLKVKVAEAELDTIEARHELIDKIRDLGDKAESNGDIKTALYALDKAVNALDSLDKRLGKLIEKPEVQVNIQVNQQFNEFMAVVMQEVDRDTRARISAKFKQHV
jgi:hypothetical protein